MVAGGYSELRWRQLAYPLDIASYFAQDLTRSLPFTVQSSPCR